MARPETGTIHFARYEDSERLQRVLNLMLDGAVRSTMEIIAAAEVCAVNSAAAELRANGFDFVCIKKCRPALYQLSNVDQARQLSNALLKKAA